MSKFGIIGLLVVINAMCIGCNKSNNVTIFNESFEDNAWQQHISFTQTNHAIVTEAYCGKRALGITDTCAFSIDRIPVHTGAVYSVSLFCRLSTRDGRETAYRTNLLMQQKMSLRIIPVSGKCKYSPRQYIWASCTPERDGKWRDLRRIFCLPDETESIYLTVFMSGNGKYEIDDIKVEEIK